MTTRYSWACWRGPVRPVFITDVIVQWRDSDIARDSGWYVVHDFSFVRARNYYIYTKTPIDGGDKHWRIVPLVPL